jgi:hypothetical protein
MQITIYCYHSATVISFYLAQSGHINRLPLYEDERSIIIVQPRSSKNIWNGTTKRRYVTSLLVEASRMRRTKLVGCFWKSRPANWPMIKFRPEQPESWKDILQGH